MCVFNVHVHHDVISQEIINWYGIVWYGVVCCGTYGFVLFCFVCLFGFVLYCIALYCIALCIKAPHLIGAHSAAIKTFKKQSLNINSNTLLLYNKTNC